MYDMEKFDFVIFRLERHTNPVTNIARTFNENSCVPIIKYGLRQRSCVVFCSSSRVL